VLLLIAILDGTKGNDGPLTPPNKNTNSLKSAYVSKEDVEKYEAGKEFVKDEDRVYLHQYGDIEGYLHHQVTDRCLVARAWDAKKKWYSAIPSIPSDPNDYLYIGLGSCKRAEEWRLEIAADLETGMAGKGIIRNLKYNRTVFIETDVLAGMYIDDSHYGHLLALGDYAQMFMYDVTHDNDHRFPTLMYAPMAHPHPMSKMAKSPDSINEVVYEGDNLCIGPMIPAFEKKENRKKPPVFVTREDCDHDDNRLRFISPELWKEEQKMKKAKKTTKEGRNIQVAFSKVAEMKKNERLKTEEQKKKNEDKNMPPKSPEEKMEEQALKMYDEVEKLVGEDKLEEIKSKYIERTKKRKGEDSSKTEKKEDTNKGTSTKNKNQDTTNFRTGKDKRSTMKESNKVNPETTKEEKPVDKVPAPEIDYDPMVGGQKITHGEDGYYIGGKKVAYSITDTLENEELGDEVVALSDTNQQEIVAKQEEEDAEKKSVVKDEL